MAQQLTLKGFIKNIGNARLFRLACHERYVDSGIKWQGKVRDYEKNERDQPVAIILQNIGINFQKFGLKAQNSVKFSQNNKNERPIEIVDETNNTSRALGSSKVGTRVEYSDRSDVESTNLEAESTTDISFLPKTVLIKQEPRTNEEYQQIEKDLGAGPFTIDDARWVDENVTQKIKKTTLEQEKEIVRIYFDDNWDRYKMYLIPEQQEVWL